MSDFGLCATDVREPRQVRKEATVPSLSVCRRSTRSLAQFILDFGFSEKSSAEFQLSTWRPEGWRYIQSQIQNLKSNI
jgi:hypothetical protein